MKVILRWATLASAVAFLAGGCAAGSGSAVVIPTVSPIRSSVPETSSASAAHAQYPIDAFMPSPLQEAELTVVTDDLVRSCMHSLGFDYEPMKQSPSQYYQHVARVHAELNSRIWGISDLQAAETIGYNVPNMTVGLPAGTPASSLPLKELLALTGSARSAGGALAHAPANSGIPNGGCETEANAELASYGLGQAEPYDSLPSDISQRSFTAAVASAQVKRTFARWSACMMTRDFRYSSPFAAAASFASAAAVSPLQIQVAVTDIGCSRKVNVQGTGFAVESAYQRQMIHRYAGLLNQLKTQLTREARSLMVLVRRFGAAGQR